MTERGWVTGFTFDNACNAGEWLAVQRGKAASEVTASRLDSQLETAMRQLSFSPDLSEHQKSAISVSESAPSKR